MTKWWLDIHPDLEGEEHMEKRYFTAVFEFTPENTPLLSFTETPWGTVVGLAVGSLMHESELYESALTDIADDGCDRCGAAAQKAIDEGNDYVRGQLRPTREVQLDLEQAIAAAGGGK